MKRFIILMLVFLAMIPVSFAETEIQFNNIPWLSDDVSVKTRLREIGFLQDNEQILLTNENDIYFISNDILNYLPTSEERYEDVCFTNMITGRGKIASYPVRNLSFVYSYDGTYKLISVKVELIGADYETLKQKLIKVYDNAEVFESKEEGIIINLWKGENNSAVLLYTQTEGLNYTLIYGRLDAAEILSNCLKTDPDDVSGL